MIQRTIFSDGDIKVELPLLSYGAEAEFSAFEDEPKVEDEKKQKYEELTDTLTDRYIIMFNQDHCDWNHNEKVYTTKMLLPKFLY
jgi:hypothetical protein